VRPLPSRLSRATVGPLCAAPAMSVAAVEWQHSSSMGMASVEERAGSLVISSYSKTVAGFETMNGWFVAIDSDSDDAVVGEAVFNALGRSERVVPTPPVDSNPLAPLLKSLGVSSWRQYVKGVRSVSVYRDDKIEIVPCENRGSKEGFVEITDDAVKLSEPTAAELGQAVRDALALAK
jgi:hypothetical protein